MTITAPRRPPAPVDAKVFEIRCEGETVHFPQPRAGDPARRTIVFEGMIAPMGIFYLVVSLADFRAALIAALHGPTSRRPDGSPAATGSRRCSSSDRCSSR